MRPRRWILALVVAGSLAFTGCSLLGNLGPDPLARICGLVRELPDGWLQVPFCFSDGTQATALVPPVVAPGIGEVPMTEVVRRAVDDATENTFAPPTLRVKLVPSAAGPVVRDLERQ